MTFLERLCSALNDHNVCYALVGGHAVAFYGAVRGTVDVDFVINWSADTLVKTEKTLKAIGLVSRLPIDANDVFKNRKHYIYERNLIAWNFYNPDNLVEQVDIIINFDLQADSIRELVIGNTVLPLLELSQLIEMKRKAGRTQDLIDVSALEAILREEQNQ